MAQFRSRRLTPLEGLQLIGYLDSDAEDEPWDCEEEENEQDVVKVIEEQEQEDFVPQIEESDDEQDEEQALATRLRREASIRKDRKVVRKEVEPSRAGDIGTRASSVLRI